MYRELPQAFPFLFCFSMLKRIFIAVFVLSLIASCAIMRPSTPLSAEAHEYFVEGNHEQALELYEAFIGAHADNVLQIPDTVYRDAGLSAFYLDNHTKALEYLNLIRHSEDTNAPTHYALAIMNREIDNLSREITALESYVKNYPGEEHFEKMRIRLFEVWVESRNYEKAYELWPEVEDEAALKEPLLNDYFTVLKALEKEEALYETASSLHDLNPDNTDALDFLARHYFWKAENRYQSEMEAYERNRTHRQYAQLLRALDVLNADFRKSLSYFLHLYELDPQPRHARLIGNIYLRFNDESKARYYHRKAGD